LRPGEKLIIDVNVISSNSLIKNNETRRVNANRNQQSITADMLLL
jgi:hypothetical protein